MNKESVCCATGHRDIPAQKVHFVREELRKEIELAIRSGCTHFICGFASGADLMFAELLVERKATCAITLEAAIPHPERMKTPDHVFQRLIRACNVVKIHSERFSKGCYMLRNRYMVEQSCRVIAVYDGRETGGTAATLRYANKLGKTVRLIALSGTGIDG